MFIAASPDEVHSFAGLKNLVCQVVGKESWYHDVVQFVLLCPELAISNVWIRLNEELLEGIIYFSSHHPCFDHRQYWRGDLLQDATDELFGGRASIQDISIDSRTDSTTFEILDKVCDDGEPLHPFEWLLHPQVKLPQIQIVCRVFERVVDSLRVKNSQQAIILGQLSLNCEAQALSHLIDVHVDGVSTISCDPISDFFEEPSKLTEFADKFVGGRRNSHGL